jgi:hypothetical protein
VLFASCAANLTMPSSVSPSLGRVGTGR